MHNRLILAGLAATGGLLTTAFLQTAVAVADAPPRRGRFHHRRLHLRPAVGAAGRRGLRPPSLRSSPPLPRCWSSVRGTVLEGNCRSQLRTSTSTTPPAAPNWGASRATRRLPASSA